MTDVGSTGSQGLEFVILMFLVVICALMVLSAHHIIETD